jgi:DNA gyrase subunit A
LIPIVLLNPQEGIAVGFATDILPRSLPDIINSQISHLSGKGFREPKPTFTPTKQRAFANGNDKWTFVGEIKKEGAVDVRVTNLPYGLTHPKFIDKLIKMQEAELINDYEDNSQDNYDILVTFKKGSLTGKSEEEILALLGLTTSLSENMNVIDFDGKRVWAATYVDLIQKFCDWRLGWYKKRYERLASLLNEEIRRYQDIILVIEKNFSSMITKFDSRAEMKEYLQQMGVVYVDYIADLPIYRFTEEEYKKVKDKLDEALAKMKEYKQLLKSEDDRRTIYVNELKEVLTKYNKGHYSAV